MQDFEPHDHFYLRNWARDLKYHFPFLAEATIEHPYQMFYFLWKLSYLHGLCYSDLSISFEELSARPTELLKRLFRTAGVVNYDLERLAALVDPPKTDRWRAYADDDWFRQHESHCETVLADFFRPQARKPVVSMTGQTVPAPTFSAAHWESRVSVTATEPVLSEVQNLR